ncbi:hypothetical protein Tco_1235514 [Tanacetum coccineum]
MTPATTTSSLLENLPNFASLFGFDDRLKALEDNFSEFRQTNQYADALSSIPGTVDQYLANKMQEAVDVAVQLKPTNLVRYKMGDKSSSKRTKKDWLADDDQKNPPMEQTEGPREEDLQTRSMKQVSKIEQAEEESKSS